MCACAHIIDWTQQSERTITNVFTSRCNDGDPPFQSDSGTYRHVAAMKRTDVQTRSRWCYSFTDGPKEIHTYLYFKKAKQLRLNRKLAKFYQVSS